MSNSLYLWLKAGHIVAVVAWMAGMFYLPRLFVYHAVAEPGSPQSETFKTMERRLLRGIINPAMIATWLFGLLLVWQGGWWGQGWLYGKLVLLLGMQVVHAGLARWRRDFAADANRHSQRFFRIVNEIPTLLLIGIVILVVVKPF